MNSDSLEPTVSPSQGSARSSVIIANTAKLSFLSFWQAAALVLLPVFSGAFFAPGVAEHAIGNSAPWFIVVVMMFSGAILAVYLESSSILSRDVYAEAKVALGGTLAKFATSALMLDYILMGPIRMVVAGHYLVGLVEEIGAILHHPFVISANHTATAYAIVLVLALGQKYLRGTSEIGRKSLRAVFSITVVVLMFMAWCLFTAFQRQPSLPPNPLDMSIIPNTRDTLGWLSGTWLSRMILITLLAGIGHASLAVGGVEVLAPISREIEHPRVRNLWKAALVVFVYGLALTSLISFFSVMIIPDSLRFNYFPNLVSGIVISLFGPYFLRLIFQVLVVLTAVFSLTMAAESSIRLSTGLMTRASNDALLPDWVGRRHPKSGTEYRAVSVILVLQLLAILISRGDILVLGATYVFAVIWSIAIKGLVVTRLRWKEPGERQFRVPLNIKMGQNEIPVGLILITVTIATIGLVRLFVDEVGTVSGIALTLVGFGLFMLYERINLKRSVPQAAPGIVNLTSGDDFSPQSLGVRPGNVLVVLLDYNTIYNLSAVLDRVDIKRQDVIGLYIRIPTLTSQAADRTVPEGSFTVKEQEVLDLALNVAEGKGKTVQLAVLSADEIWDGILRAAQSIQSSTIVLGIFPRRPPREEFLFANTAWERLPQPKPRLNVEIISKNSERLFYYLGPHSPRLSEKQIELLHRLWLRFGEALGAVELHHQDIVHFALLALERGVEGDQKEQMLRDLKKHLHDASREPS